VALIVKTDHNTVHPQSAAFPLLAMLSCAPHIALYRDKTARFSLDGCQTLVQVMDFHQVVKLASMGDDLNGLFKTCKALHQCPMRRRWIEIRNIYQQRIDALYRTIKPLPVALGAQSEPTLIRARSLIACHRQNSGLYMSVAISGDRRRFRYCIAPLIQHCGIDLNRRLSDEATALMAAIKRYNSPIAEELLQYPQTQLSLVDRHGESALDIALAMHNPDMVRLLAAHGAGQQLTQVPLIEAIVKNEPKRFEELLQKGADPNSHTARVTALSAAILVDCTWAFDALMDIKTINVNFKPKPSWAGKPRTAIMTAVRMQRVDMVAKLIDMGAGVRNHVEHDYYNPGRELLVAAGDNQQIRDLLLAAGACPPEDEATIDLS
jgi:hypothetical protein